jgi:hypothetical protein
MEIEPMRLQSDPPTLRALGVFSGPAMKYAWPKYWPLIIVSFSASDQKLHAERSQCPGAMFVRFYLRRDEKAQGRREKFRLL